MKTTIVKKFGGTSVGIPERLDSLCSLVSSRVPSEQQILVVSAVSGVSKAEGTTSLLLKCLESSLRETQYQDCLKSIAAQHDTLLQGCAPETRESFSSFLQHELKSLQELLEGISQRGECSELERDSVMSYGERLSAHLVTSLLNDRDVSARVCDLSESLSVSEEADYDVIASEIAQAATPRNEEVVVCTGYFGPFPGGLLEVVGRGYSDLCAALIARGLGSGIVSELQIWKEVDGVFTADPRKVATAKVLHEITAREAAELTFFGSEVLHPYTMEQAVSAGVQIKVLNSLRPEMPGTVIVPKRSVVKDAPTAVTAKKGIVSVSVTSNRMYDAKGFLARLFEILRNHNLIVDLVSTSEVTVSCTVGNANRLRNALSDLEELGDIEIREGQAILSVVGEGLQASSIVPSKMFAALGQAGIRPDMVTQATSRMSISCVLSEDLVENALECVHEELFKS